MTLEQADAIDQHNRKREGWSVFSGAALGVAVAILFVRTPYWLGSLAALIQGALILSLGIGGAYLGARLFKRCWRQEYF